MAYGYGLDDLNLEQISERMNEINKTINNEAALRQKAEEDYQRLALRNLEQRERRELELVKVVDGLRIKQLEERAKKENDILEHLHKIAISQEEAINKLKQGNADRELSAYEAILNEEEQLERQKEDRAQKYYLEKFAKKNAANKAYVKAIAEAEMSARKKLDQDLEKAEKYKYKKNREKAKQLAKEEYETAIANAKKTFAATNKEYAKAAKEAEKIRDVTGTQDITGQMALANGAFGSMQGFGNSTRNIGQAIRDAKDNTTANSTAVNALAGLAVQLENTIDSIAGKKSRIDTRLQGSKNRTGLWGSGFGGSYWDALSSDVSRIVGISPLVKQEDFANNIERLVGQGIAYNIEQRAFLATVSEKIATTFNATNGTLLRLIRIQQQDTTAARLGMESALNSFLNNMYETTEYMSDIAASIKGSIEESMALMTAERAVGYEYQVQKWMGSMYSVGMSSSGVSGIASALGRVAAGDISGITGGGAGNLIVMAANTAGISIADALRQGLDDSSTNRLMRAMVQYLGKIYNESSDSLVVQQQLAKVFGLSASDLKAVRNLVSSTENIFGSSLDYGGALKQLRDMSASMYARTSMGEMLNNAWGNVTYGMAGGIASNPALYGVYKAASLLDAVTGGIAIPAISVLGNMVDLETTVANLMRVGALSGGILSSIGNLIAGIAGGTAGGFNPVGMLNAAGVFNGNAVQRGTGQTFIASGGATVSESGYVGNAAGGDVYGKTLSDVNDSKSQQLAEAQESGDVVDHSKNIDENLVAIYSLLQSVVDGTASLHVITGSDRLNGVWT